MQQYYTIAEANAALPRLRPLVKRIMDAWARLDGQRAVVQQALQRARNDVGGGALTQAAADMVRIQEGVERLNADGIELKDPASGLIDFRALRKGQAVYLCWRYGEPEVQFWHDLDAGFAGRRPIGEF
jgi:hypothetical protein